MTDNSRTDGPVLASACLLGIKSRYDALSAQNADVLRAARGRTLVPVCPEQLAGLPTPRPRAEIIGGTGADVLDNKATVIDETGKDVTAQFITGAKMVLTIARLNNTAEVFLKEKSPSCGVCSILSGTDKVDGSGVTTALLVREGFTVRGF